MTIPKKKNIEGSMAAEIAAPRTLTVAELQLRYSRLFGRESRSRNRDWLFKKVAFRMQEVRRGGPSERAKRRARELAKGSYLRSRPPKGFCPEPAPPPQAHPKDPRLPAVGTVLTREQGGETHAITVLGDGFEYRGEIYPSLSRIAKAVTGTSWNGFLWLGLDTRKRGKKEATA
jgi:hypothetical protein